MKKIILILITTIIVCCATAQEKNIEKEYKWGVGFNASNAGMFDKLWLQDYDPGIGGGYSTDNTKSNKAYAFGLSGYYSFNKNKTLQIKAQIAKENITSSDNSGNYTVTPPSPPGTPISSYNMNAEQTIKSFEPSIIWKNELKKITIYEGFTLPIIFIGKYNSDYYGLETTNNVTTYESTSSIILPGGFATGLGILSGLNLNINNHLKIGMEFSFAYLYSNSMGEEIGTNNVTVPANSSYTQKSTTEFTRTRYEFTHLNTSINILYSF